MVKGRWPSHFDLKKEKDVHLNCKRIGIYE